MDDVIEASEDGGFDIPTTSVAPPSRLTNLPSLKEDSIQPKPRRISIQLEEDDDNEEEEDDDNEGKNDCARNVGASTAAALTDAGRPEKGMGSPAVDRPQYKIYRVETPNEDSVLEIVVSLSTESTVAPISTAAKHVGTKDAPQATSCPSVHVSSDGGSIVVEHNSSASGDGGGEDGDAGARGRFTLKLPQKVIPRTAMSFYWGSELTIRAALARVE